MRYYIIAGEASGDLHGANLIHELKNEDNDAIFRCWGGDLMKEEGATLVKHYRELAFMGFLEVIANLKTILQNIRFCKDDILNFKPDALILIDYPGFNLRIAEWAKENNIKVIYYISPQVWAWKASRVHKIKKVVDLMIVILPFEEAFYRKYNYKVHFVGHPLLDEIAKKEFSNSNWKASNNLNDQPIIALLPGSRKQEISMMLPIMLTACNDLVNSQFVIAAAPGQPASFYSDFIKSFKGNISVLKGETYALLANSYVALVTSGTATLETALFEVPEVVCYKGNYLSYLIARQLIKIKFISLVNLVMDKEVVKELIQQELTAKNLRMELMKMVNPENRQIILKNYLELKKNLGGVGASSKTAKLIAEFLHEK